jgi:hypothetical protein
MIPVLLEISLRKSAAKEKRLHKRISGKQL